MPHDIRHMGHARYSLPPPCYLLTRTLSRTASIRHAVSTSPTGPWQPKELILDGSGNPVLTGRAPDGTYLLYFTGIPRPWSKKLPARDCTSANQSDWGPTTYCTAPANCATGLHLAYSNSLDGPWSVEFNVASGSGTNPGGMILNSGRVLFFYKSAASFRKSEACPSGHCRAIQVWHHLSITVASLYLALGRWCQALHGMSSRIMRALGNGSLVVAPCLKIPAMDG